MMIEAMQANLTQLPELAEFLGYIETKELRNGTSIQGN